MIGFEVTAFAMVTLRAQGEAELREFENRVLTWPIVREAYMLAGDADYMLKCVASDMASFQAFVLDQLTALPNVASVKTTVVLREPSASRACRSRRGASVPTAKFASSCCRVGTNFAVEGTIARS